MSPHFGQAVVWTLEVGELEVRELEATVFGLKPFPWLTGGEIAGDTLREHVDLSKMDIERIPKSIRQTEVRMTLAPEEEIKKVESDEFESPLLDALFQAQKQ